MRDLRVISRIIIEQQPTDDFPARNKRMDFDFCNAVEIVSSWADLTDTAKVTLPRNVKVKAANCDGGYIDLGNLIGQGSNAGGFKSDPVFLRGDKITIYLGYIYRGNDDKENISINQDIEDNFPSFRGYITKVDSSVPFVLNCEDNMWKLKQKLTPNKHWKGYALEDILKECIEGTGFTVSTKSQTSLTFDTGPLITENATVCHLLEKMRKEYNLESYFRGDELRVGFPIYYEEEAKNHVFEFQDNIISADDLKYNRKDDILIGAKVVAMKLETGSKTKSGADKSKLKRENIIVGKTEGMLLTFFYLGKNPTDAEMRKFGEDELKKYYYDGFRGSFITYGLPKVKHGDNAIIRDKIISGRDGTYKIKKVETSLNLDGLRQKLTIDYRANI